MIKDFEPANKEVREKLLSAFGLLESSENYKTGLVLVKKKSETGYNFKCAFLHRVHLEPSCVNILISSISGKERMVHIEGIFEPS